MNEMLLLVLIAPFVVLGFIISILFIVVTAFLPIIAVFYPDSFDHFSSEFSDD